MLVGHDPAVPSARPFCFRLRGVASVWVAGQTGLETGLSLPANWRVYTSRARALLTGLSGSSLPRSRDSPVNSARYALPKSVSLGHPDRT